MLEVLRGYAAEAGRVLEPGWYDYLETGAGEEVSLNEAESAWRSYRLRPRVLRPVPLVSTACGLLGSRLATPIMVAPTAWHRMAHPDGEIETARGASAAGALMVVSTRASRPLAEIAAVADHWWFQVYLTEDRTLAEGMAREAADLGAGALVLTGDTPIVPIRTRNRVPAAADADPLLSLRPFLSQDSSAAGRQTREAAMADVARLHDLTGLPVLVKGVLRGDDAVACLDAGAAGIVVSNHGGRQLDRAVATAVALPEVVAAVAGRAPVLVDGGIRSGVDALVALTLGASAVLLGRPPIWGLAAGGADGVRAVLDAITDDLLQAMTLLGARDLTEISREDVM
jgi:4-hydroxymandelate oxidase